MPPGDTCPNPAGHLILEDGARASHTVGRNTSDTKEAAVAKSALLLIGSALLTLAASPLLALGDQSHDWPSFRGPGASGIARANLPDGWDVSRSENIRWRTPVEGLGHGGPAVWGNKVFLVTAANGTPQPVKTGVFGDIAPVENEKPFEWKLLCVDLQTGAVLWNRTAAYDLQTGKEVWTLAMPGDIPIPTPVAAGDLVFFTSAHGGPSGVYAVRTSATGNITPPAGQTTSPGVAWSTNRGGSYIPTPIVAGDLLYCCNWTGVLTCFEARTGREVYHTRLPGSEAGFTASPVGTADKLYLVSEEGNVAVVQTGPEFRLLATNSLGSKCLAAPAIAGDTLLSRTESALIAIGNPHR